MTVAELKIALAELPKEFDNFLVVLSKDAEGNGFKPLSEEFSFKINDEFKISEYFYDADERELVAYNESDYDSFEDFEEEVGECLYVEPCIVLWPS